MFKGKLDKSSLNTQVVDREKDKKSEDKLSSDGITAALKGAAALGVVAGGTVLTANTALADTKQLDADQNLVNKETVNLSSGSGSSSTSDSLSTSESDIQSNTSASQSKTISLDSSSVASETSTSTASDSKTESVSNSDSKSQSQSQSQASNNSTTSQSIASLTITNSNSVADTSSTGTSDNDAKAKIEELLKKSGEFVNSNEFKNSNSDLRDTYKSAIAAVSEQIKTRTDITNQDYEELASQLNELAYAIKSGYIPTQSFYAVRDANFIQPDTNTADGDTAAFWRGNYKWIVGDKRLWSDLNVYTGHDDTKRYPPEQAEKNLVVAKENLGNGEVRWTIVFYPNKGIWYKGYDGIYGLKNAQMGFYLTKDYTVVGDITVNIQSSKDSYYYVNGGNKAYINDSAPEGYYNGHSNVNKTFSPTDADPTTGIIVNNDFAGGDRQNQYVQYARFASRDTTNDFDKIVFKDESDNKNLGSFAYNNEFDQAGLLNEPPTSDLVNYKAPFTTPFSKDTIGTAMYMQSWGTGGGSQDATFTVSFVTTHSNEAQKDLKSGANNGAFSGIYAIANSYQDGFNYDNLYGELLGEEVYNLNNDGTLESDETSQIASESTHQSESTSVSISTEASLSVSTESSASVSRSQSEYDSRISEFFSKSASASTLLSESLSESISASLSRSQDGIDQSERESLSVSESESASISTSISNSESLSNSISANESLSSSVSASESLSNSLSLSTSLSRSQDGIDQSERESLSASESMSMSLSASLNESLSQAQSNTDSTNTSLSNSTNGNNTVVTPTNFVSNNKVASDSLKHSVRRQTLPQTGDNTNNTGVLGGLFVLTSLALMKAKKKKD